MKKRVQEAAVEAASHFENGQNIQGVWTLAQQGMPGLVAARDFFVAGTINRVLGVPSKDVAGHRLEDVFNARDMSGISVAMLDLVEFGQVNNTFSQDAGDELLGAYGYGLQQNVRTSDRRAKPRPTLRDVLARKKQQAVRRPDSVAGNSVSEGVFSFGGDELLIVFEGIDSRDQLQSATQRIISGTLTSEPVANAAAGLASRCEDLVFTTGIRAGGVVLSELYGVDDPEERRIEAARLWDAKTGDKLTQMHASYNPSGLTNLEQTYPELA